MRDNGPQKTSDALPFLSFGDDEEKDIPVVDLRKETIPAKPNDDVSCLLGAVEFLGVPLGGDPLKGHG